jgi:hypothetical protein
LIFTPYSRDICTTRKQVAKAKKASKTMALPNGVQLTEWQLFPEKSEHRANVYFYVDTATGIGVFVGVLLLLVIYKRLLT